MERLYFPDEVVFRLQIEKRGETLYDLGVSVDPCIVAQHPEEALEQVLRLFGKRVAHDLKTKGI